MSLSDILAIVFMFVMVSIPLVLLIAYYFKEKKK